MEVCILLSGTSICMIIRPDITVVKTMNPVHTMVDETPSKNRPPRARPYDHDPIHEQVNKGSRFCIDLHNHLLV
jgi:hypothetical protein